MTSNTQQTLLHKLNTRSATVAVIGLGYVGLPPVSYTHLTLPTSDLV